MSAPAPGDGPPCLFAAAFTLVFSEDFMHFQAALWRTFLEWSFYPRLCSEELLGVSELQGIPGTQWVSELFSEPCPTLPGERVPAGGNGHWLDSAPCARPPYYSPRLSPVQCLVPLPGGLVSRLSIWPHFSTRAYSCGWDCSLVSFIHCNMLPWVEVEAVGRNVGPDPSSVLVCRVFLWFFYL